LYVIAQQNFHDKEFKIPKEIFEAEGFKVMVASITTDQAVGTFGLRIKPDIAIIDVNPNDFDALVIAGGIGAPKLADYPEVLNLIRVFAAQNKPVAAICIAGYILCKAGILKGRRATVYPADFALTEFRREGVIYSDEEVVVDGKIVTANGPTAARTFAEQIVKLLK